MAGSQSDDPSPPDAPSTEEKRTDPGRANGRRKPALLVALALVVVLGVWLIARGGDSEPAQIGFVGQELLGLDLDQQVKEKDHYWERYDDRDAPEGAFMGWMMPGAGSLEASIPLGRTIDPGKYFLFLKDRNYDHPIGVTLSLGGGEAKLTTTRDDDRDESGYWSNRVPITVKSSTDELDIRLARADDGTDDKRKLLLRGLYLTSDPDDIVLATDRVVRLAEQRTVDDSAPRPGNVIDNGSFEAGLGHGWGSRDDRRFAIDSLWDPSTGKDGSASLRLPLDPSQTASAETAADHATIVSKAYAVAPNKRHTLSVWLKSEPGAPVEGAITLANAFGPPAAPKIEGRREHELSQDFKVGGDWTRVDLSGVLLRYPTADYHVSIRANHAAGRHLWVDAMSLNEGGPVPFAAKAPLEIGVQRTQPSNLYYDDEPVKLRLRAANAGAESLERTVRYEVYDDLGRKLQSGGRKLSVPGRSVKTTDLDLSRGGRRGSFRLVTWVQGEDGSEEEVAYGVVPRPRRSGADPGSLIGIHSNFTDFQFDAMQRLGIKWDRAMSPGAFFRWRETEPRDNEFVWHDAEVDRAARRGVAVLGTLGSNDEWPEFANDKGGFSLDKWEEYVGQVVSHYRGRVRAWEIWNEPNYEFDPDYYAQMLKRGAEAIKRADPSASVIAIGGAPEPEYAERVFEELRKQSPGWERSRYIDVISMHMYPARSEQEPTAGGRAAAFRSRILPAYKLPVWNTETGEWDTGFYRTVNAVRQPWGRNLFGVGDAAQFAASAPHAIQSVSQTFLETIGNGLDKFFYYDFRVQASPTYPLSHPTMLEYDDTVRPKAIAYAVLAHLFDHSTGLGRIDVGDRATQAYLFRRGDASLVGLYTLDDRPRSITPSGIAADRLKVYDSMGNRVPTKDGRIDYGPTPVYVEAAGVAADALRDAFKKATVAARKDTQAPAPTIDEGPRGPVDGGSTVHVRWSATDDISVPTNVAPTAVTYSYRVTGLDGHEDWSDWATADSTELADLDKGSYTFEVRAKDEAGNSSKPERRAIDVR